MAPLRSAFPAGPAATTKASRPITATTSSESMLQVPQLDMETTDHRVSEWSGTPSTDAQSVTTRGDSGMAYACPSGPSTVDGTPPSGASGRGTAGPVADHTTPRRPTKDGRPVSCISWVWALSRAVKGRNRSVRCIGDSVASMQGRKDHRAQYGWIEARAKDPTALEALARAAEETVRAAPPAAAALAARKAESICEFAQCATLKASHANACLAIPYGKAMNAVHRETIAALNRLLELPPSAAQLQAAWGTVREAVDRMLELSESHFTLVGEAFASRGPADRLLPRFRTSGSNSDTQGKRLAVLGLFALSTLGSVCTRATCLSMTVAQNPEVPASLKAHARALKRDLCLLRGTATHLTLHPLQLLATVLKVQLVTETDEEEEEEENQDSQA